MKLVELLAKELSYWSEGAYAYAQDGNRKTYAWTGIPEFDGEDWLVTDDADIDQGASEVLYLQLASDYGTAVVTKKQWQAERDRQNGGEWKRHRGNGNQPKELGDFPFEVKHRDGNIWPVKGIGESCWRWTHDGSDDDIMQYRIISQPQAEEVGVTEFKIPAGAKVQMARMFDGETPKTSDWFTIGYASEAKVIHGPIKMGESVIAPAHPEYKGEDTGMGTLSYTAAIDTSPAMQALNELSAKWDQVESPFKWRDTVNELNAYIEEFTRERDELINRLALEGFALIPAMTAVVGVADIVYPIEEWQIGDIVEVVSLEAFCDCGIRIGDQMPITHIDKHDGTAKVASGAWGDEENYKFIRRP